ncbi:caspase family protein [Roseateles agri]|uniref:caspase family protein n=1 Tax=Roseateles agri TaxID=3098619 RepID=UPI002A5AF056|nr:caspase family protein [Paucibacter sp. R3-3]
MADARAVQGKVDLRSPDIASTRKFALVIGNAAYANIPQLKNSVNDARDMCKSLRELDFEVSCFYDLATKAEFRQAVRNFAVQLNPHTASFIYYAGHGVQINGENFLLPTSVSAEASLDMEDDSLNLGYLLRSLASAKSSPNIVVLDACRDNPFAASGNMSEGLARVDPPLGTVLVYATAPNSRALDGRDSNGLFTKHLLAHIGEPGRKLDELFRVVALGVEDEARNQYKYLQVPYRSSSFSGDYCLAGCENPAVLAKMEEIARQSAEAVRRIEVLNEENARLKRQTEERERNIASLESKIGLLNKDVAAAGDKTSGDRADLERLKAALAAALKEQKEAEGLKAEVARRNAEVDGLHRQIESFKSQTAELENYRQRIAVLERENADRLRVTKEIDEVRRQSLDAEQRVKALSDENARLRTQAASRDANITALERRIEAATSSASSAGNESAKANAELARLRQALQQARDERNTAELMDRSSDREQEIAGLKAQISTFQAKTSELEQLRQRIIALEKTNADQKKMLKDRDSAESKVRPAIIPSF